MCSSNMAEGTQKTFWPRVETRLWFKTLVLVETLCLCSLARRLMMCVKLVSDQMESETSRGCWDAGRECVCVCPSLHPCNEDGSLCIQKTPHLYFPIQTKTAPNARRVQLMLIENEQKRHPDHEECWETECIKP